MSLPLGFFQAIEAASLPSQDQDRASSSSSSKQEDNDDVRTWSHLLPSRLLVQLPQLRKLQVWLDHNGKDYWSVVNERVVLAPMEALKTINPELELVCALPKVHPKVEDRQRHYLPGDEEDESFSSSRLEFHRFLRQRYRVLEDAITGDQRIIYVTDFPHIVGNPNFDNWSLAEKESMESAMWRSGTDVDRLLGMSLRFKGRIFVRTSR